MQNRIILRDTMEYVLQHPQWSLSLQTHKLLGIRWKSFFISVFSSRAYIIYNVYRRKKFSFCEKRLLFLCGFAELLYLCTRKREETASSGTVRCSTALPREQVLWEIYIDRDCSTRKANRQYPSKDIWLRSAGSDSLQQTIVLRCSLPLPLNGQWSMYNGQW